MTAKKQPSCQTLRTANVKPLFENKLVQGRRGGRVPGAQGTEERGIGHKAGEAHLETEQGFPESFISIWLLDPHRKNVSERISVGNVGLG